MRVEVPGTPGRRNPQRGGVLQDHSYNFPGSGFTVQPTPWDVFPSDGQSNEAKEASAQSCGGIHPDAKTLGNACRVEAETGQREPDVAPSQCVLS